MLSVFKHGHNRQGFLVGNAYPAIAEKADKLFYKLGVKIIARVYQVFNAVCLVLNLLHTPILSSLPVSRRTFCISSASLYILAAGFSHKTSLPARIKSIDMVE